ncbi:MAG: hypothetical protein VX113_09905, partial [Pseudomonadota bacterium]|nr:hypothetical protein [Pseudomonadota bacterium]
MRELLALGQSSASRPRASPRAAATPPLTPRAAALPTEDAPFVFCPRGGFIEPDTRYEVCVKARLEAGEHAGETVTSNVLEARTACMPRVDLAAALPEHKRHVAHDAREVVL